MEFAQSHQEMSNNWSSFSQDFMRNVLDQSRHKLAILQDWRLDAKKKVHGDLILLGFAHKISLCKLLVTTGHGDFFPELLKTDLEARTQKRIGPRFTSIVAPGATPGTRTLESELNFSIMTEEELVSLILCYRIMLLSGMNVPHGKFGKKNNHIRWKKRTPWKTIES